MDIRQNVRTVKTRPIVLAIATLFALALGVSGWYAVVGSPSSHVAVIGPALQNGGLPGPDARDRNEQMLATQGQAQPAPEATHGH
jgi:hypothetical protein